VAQLDAKIQNIFRKFDANTLETMADRVKFYHGVSTPFRVTPLEPSEDAPVRSGCHNPSFGLLKENTLRKGVSSVYIYDTVEWTRYFPDTLKWYYAFGDVNYYLHAPACTKTRPILPPAQEHAAHLGQNSILLQLDKQRHFTFIRDPYRFEEKQDVLFFRGGIYQSQREAFFGKFFHAPWCDIGHTGHTHVHPDWLKPKISKARHLPYKFLLSLEGNDVASNLKWIMHSNSLCVMPKPKYESWFMESRLQAGVHYCEIRDDYADVEDKLEYYRTHPNDAKAIIQHAQAFCRRFQNKTVEAALHLLVLRKYFYLSGQMDVTPQEKAFFALR